MSRLTATLQLDARLQARNNVYWIVGIAAVGLALALGALFTPDQLRFFMPLVALSGISITSFFLVGVLVMLERGAASGFAVPPQRQVEIRQRNRIVACEHTGRIIVDKELYEHTVKELAF